MDYINLVFKFGFFAMVASVFFYGYMSTKS